MAFYLEFIRWPAGEPSAPEITRIDEEFISVAEAMWQAETIYGGTVNLRCAEAFRVLDGSNLVISHRSMDNL